MDYIHCNSLIFGNVRSAIDDDSSEESCIFCNMPNDSPEHQLLLCTEVADNTQHIFASKIKANNTNYIQEVLVPTEVTFNPVSFKE